MAMTPAPSNEWAVAIVCVWAIFCPLSTLAVILRLWSRNIQKATLALNDYAIMLALV